MTDAGRASSLRRRGGAVPVTGILLALSVLNSAGCSSRERSHEGKPLPLPVDVRADTARSFPLAAELRPAARVWVAHVTPAPLNAPGPALPEAVPDTPVVGPEPPALVIDPGLEPPILRRPAVLEIPGEWRRRHARAVQSVDLDVLVDDTGEVSDVDCTAGCSDSLLVEAARRCARTMRFYPALRGGWPVAVWCRQRFDFGAK